MIRLIIRLPSTLLTYGSGFCDVVRALGYSGEICIESCFFTESRDERRTFDGWTFFESMAVEVKREDVLV